MNRKGISFPYFILGVFLFAWVNIPLHVADEMRYFSVASLSPAWGWTKEVKRYLSDRPEALWAERKGGSQEIVEQLELENVILRSSLEKMSKWLSQEKKVFAQLEEAKTRSNSHLLELIQSELMAMPAQVIYRDPSSWSSSLWVGVGEEDNRALGRSVIAKNSPVVSGLNLVGVVDYVGEKQSRVRLITDSGLTPAVRALRGKSQNQEIVSLAQALISLLGDKEKIVEDLKNLEKIKSHSEDRYLAKGELHGSSSPLWRARNLSLKGIGFNFDCPDEAGSAKKGESILEKGDLLVTTGFDGVFPPDLRVAIVTAVTPPIQSGYTYEIEARPLANNLNDLETVFVLPARSD